jgi:hypothetical protein
MATVFFTGFPGHLGSELVPRVLSRLGGTEAVCLVQPKFIDKAVSFRAKRRFTSELFDALHPLAVTADRGDSRGSKGFQAAFSSGGTAWVSRRGWDHTIYL